MLEIDEKVLSDLLVGYHKYIALESGGVDNWMWYCDSINDYIKEYNAEHNTNFEYIEEIVKWELSQEDVEDEVE